MTQAGTRGIPGHRCHLDLVASSDGDRLDISGELDLATSCRLTSVLDRIDILHRPLVVGLSDVTFADSAGIAPIVECCRHRSMTGEPPLRVAEPSVACQRLFSVLLVDWREGLDWQAWDQAGARLSELAREPVALTR